jgi:glucose-1-phosphate thymidylyltransferase
MRALDGTIQLSAAQARAADAGMKSMFPIHGRPLLDYVLSEAADAGLTDIAVVVAPEHDAIRRRYTVDAPPQRVRLSFLVQQEAHGTADALLVVEPWAAGDPFIVLNADNIYPARVLTDLAALDGPGLPVFEAGDLVRTSNIPRKRIAAFALIELDRDGYLTKIVEKPGDLPAEAGSHTSGDQTSRHSSRVASAFRRKILVSMNCWKFDSGIFSACRDVPRSSRGEYELPQAVGLAVSRGTRFRGVPARGPVLDLSRRADAADLERRLAGAVPRP